MVGGANKDARNFVFHATKMRKIAIFYRRPVGTYEYVHVSKKKKEVSASYHICYSKQWRKRHGEKDGACERDGEEKM